jgi:hypothetical protein
MLVQVDEATAAQRRVYFHLVDATDGITAETGEANGQPQISSDGAAWTNAGIGTLSAVGNGRYYADLTAGAVDTVGTVIETRYKSDNTAESPGDTARVVSYDPNAVPTVSEIASSILVTPENLLLTDDQGFVTAIDTDGTIISYSFEGTFYCSRSDVNDIFGATNVTTWGDLDNDADDDKITTRIARAISWATTEINDRLRGGPYEIPLPESTSSTIVDLCASLAGVWLYRSRGIDDEAGGNDKYSWQWDRVETTLSEIRAGKRKLDATPSTSTGSGGCGQAPFAV